MADGYIENRMAQHRASSPRSAATSRRRDVLKSSMPEKRVLIIGRPSPVTAAIAKIFAEAGCRVGLLTDMPENAPEYEILTSVRLIDIAGLDGLLQVWHDVDIIIADHFYPVIGLTPDEVIEKILSHRQTLPLPNSYGLRLIQLTDGNNPVSMHAPFLSTVNTISVPRIPDSAADDIARTALFLSLPWAGCIDGSSITIKNVKR